MHRTGRWTCGLGLAAAGLLGATVVGAQEASRDTYFGVGLGYVSPDGGARDAEKGFGAQALFGWELGRYLNAELATRFVTLEDTERALPLLDYFRGDDGTGSTSRISLGGDLLWVPFQGWSPFVVAGLGGAYNKGDPDNDSGIDLFTNYGFGFMSAPLGSYGLRLRAEWRQVNDGYVDKPKDRHIFVSINFPLRSGSAPVARSAPPPAPPMPPASPVQPAPASPPAAANTPAPDNAAQPPLPPIPQVDDDGDGIFNAQDRCPATLPGLRVDQYGCAMEGAIATIPGLRFVSGAARIEPASTPTLIRLTDALEGQPSMRIEVRGHTDSVGDAASNMRLSEQRAAAIGRYLETEGIEGWRITTAGFGSTRPVADNATEDGRASNRRVEIRVISP